MSDGVRRVRLRTSRGYEVLIGDGLFRSCGDFISALRTPCQVALITDRHVDALHSAGVMKSLAGSGFSVDKHVIEPGEGSKSLESYGRLLEFLADRRFSKKDLVVALGGGVVGDLSGFAAATYLRGMDYIQMATTLLAAVDSSVGGKTAVNLKAGKNLAGAFCQPRLVLVDTRALGTLPPAIYRDGMAEVVKYGMIADEGLLEGLARGDARWEGGELIERCVRIKAAFVEEDEFDAGNRQLLNFGHTVGHAAERLSGYALSHSQAVSAGMSVVTRAAVRRGWCPQDCLRLLLAALDRHGLPTSCAFSAEELAGAAVADKKRAGDTIVMAIPSRPGLCVLRPLPMGELAALIADGKEG